MLLVAAVAASIGHTAAAQHIAYVTMCMGARRRGLRAEFTSNTTSIPGSIQMHMEDMCSTSICAFAKHVDTAVHRTYSFVDISTPSRVLALYERYGVRPVNPFKGSGPHTGLGASLPEPHASWPIPVSPLRPFELLLLYCLTCRLGCCSTFGPSCSFGVCGKTTSCFSLTLM